PNEILRLKANPDYWDGAPYLDGVTFVNFAGAQTTYEAFESGQTAAAFLRDERVISDAIDSGYPGFLQVAGLSPIVAINNAEGRPGADIRVRRAIAAALDPELFNQRAADGQGHPTTQLFGPLSAWQTSTPGP